MDFDRHYYRNYVDQGTALAQNLTYASGDTLILRADDTTVLSASDPGRNSVRLQSNNVYSNHVTVCVLLHGFALLLLGCTHDRRTRR